MTGADTNAVAGNLSIDDLVFADGTTQWEQPGGAALYAALAMRLCGLRPSVISLVGPDYPLDHPSLHDINFSACRRMERTLRNWGVYEDDGTRHFIFRSATRPHERFSPDVELLTSARFESVHLAPVPWELQIELAKAARSRGKDVIVTVDPHDQTIVGHSRADIAEALRPVDAFLPSRQELLALGFSDDPIEAMLELRRMLPDTPALVIKMGERGALIHGYRSPDIIRLPSAATRLVEPTGAGDAFCGGFLAGYLAGRDAAEGGVMGTVAASFAVEGMGFSALAVAKPDEAKKRKSWLADRIERVPLAVDAC